jgi:hypothetical protein
VAGTLGRLPPILCSVGEVEECLVHLIAYKFWCWIGRLIPYERDLTFAKVTTPSDSLIGDGCSSEDIQKVLNTPNADLEAQQKAAVAQQARYEALGNGEGSELVFSAPEVEELVGWFLKRIQTYGWNKISRSSENLSHRLPPRWQVLT